MTAHHHHQPGRAWRWVLAKLTFDTHAEQIVVGELGGCGRCWAALADELAEELAYATVGEFGCPSMHPHTRLVTGGAVDYAVRRIACALDAAELDAA